ncbi:MAG: PilZ domain-containing protein [Myxococcales bacterium]|nr:PilZ domain-containing protein [Myxococcales bacterium]
MNPGRRREHPRVSYQAEVHLYRAGGEGMIRAKALDLSSGGVGLLCSGTWAVGAAVECELKDEAGLFRVPGKVIWAVGPRDETKTQVQLGAEDKKKPQTPPEACMGVAFMAAEDESTTRLRVLLEEAAPLKTPVELSLPALNDTIRARAEMAEGGLRLHTALPFLRIGEGVGVRFAREAEPTAATLRRVELSTANGTPELAVTIGFGPEDDNEVAEAGEGADGDAGTGEAGEAGPSAEPAADAAAGATQGEDALAAQPRLPQPDTVSSPAGRFGTGALFLALVLGVVIGALATLAVAGGQGQSPDQAGDVLETDPALEPAVPEAPPAAAPAQAGDDALAEAAAQARGDGGATASTATAPELLGNLHRPVVETFEGGMRVRIPLRGETRDMRSYPLSSPGIVIELPHAKATIPIENYGVHHGPVRRVWLRDSEDGGLQVRVIYTREPRRHELRLEQGGLTIELWR